MEYIIADIRLELPDRLIPPRFAGALSSFAPIHRGEPDPEARRPGGSDRHEAIIPPGLPIPTAALRQTEGIRRSPGWHELLRFDFAEAEADCRFGRDPKGWLLEMAPRRSGHAARFRYPAEEKTALCDYTPRLHPGLFRFGVWMLFNLTALQHATTAMHASATLYRNRALLFLGESGTGKSTHSRLWRENIPGAELLNDDSPILGCRRGEIRVWRSPWSGKESCYRNESYPVAAFVRLVQSSQNRIRRLVPVEALGALLPSAPPALIRDAGVCDAICSLLGDAVVRVPVYRLECRPDAEAARLVWHTIFGTVPSECGFTPGSFPNESPLRHR